MTTTVYNAKEIITMDRNCPKATHVAVRDGRILAVGTLEEVGAWGDFELDERFSDKFVMPGFVEGHAHTAEGTLWRKVYCGFFDRTDPDGKTWPGVKKLDEILVRLTEAEKGLTDPAEPLSGWQIDPIYLDIDRISRHDLDRVTETRPIGVMNASGHILYVNTKSLELSDLMKKGVNHPGIPLGEDGFPTGELKGPEAMMPVGRNCGFDRALTYCDKQGLREFGKLCVRTGTTTITDLAALLTDEIVSLMKQVTEEESYPACVVPLRFFLGMEPKELVDYVVSLKKMSSKRLRLGRIKVVADGSIQGFSARLRWPGYHNGAPNGLWYVAPEQLLQIYELALKSGVQVHTHTNGDEATELALEMLEKALGSTPRPDHRFTLQHCQLADASQFHKMAKLGACVNLFANHHYYWGDEHYRLTVGPDRARRMNACRTALDSGIAMAIHSDAPVTPLGPLFTAWCAINRLTASGRVQGSGERISMEEALHAITLGAAYTLHMDHEVGSIEVGKNADFAILEQNPYEMGPERLKDVTVWGTVQGGRIFEATSP